MITGHISHDEAVIQHFSEDPELAKIMLLDAIQDDDYDEAKKILRRIDEAKIRSELDDYWDALIRHAKQTALDGLDIDNIIARLYQAITILQAAAKSQSA